MAVGNRTRNQYEVVFNLEGIKLDSDPLTIGDVVFQEFSPEFLEVDGPFREMLQRWLDELTGQSVGIVRVHAGSAKEAVDRAREGVDRALNTLRFCVGSFPPAVIHDQELLQRRGRFYVVRQIEPEVGPVLPGWERGFRPIDRELGGPLDKWAKWFIEQLSPLYNDTIQGKIRDALLRSIEWIGTSITRENFDHKVIDLCTALEAVLATKDDPRKGQAIALRSMLLSMALDEGFPSPGGLYHLYELRSKVVHGAALGVCEKSDYWNLRRRAEETILNIIKLNSTQGPVTRPSRLIKLLESPERLEKAVCWLERWPDEDTKAVAEYAKQRLEEQS